MLSGCTPFESSPVDHAEAAKALVSLQCQACLPTTLDPIVDLNSHQNVHGPPARPSVDPTALFLQPDIPREVCSGLNDARIDELAKTNPKYCYNAFETFRGVWRSRNCEYDAPDSLKKGCK